LSLSVSHLVCCGIVMYFDLTGKWDEYRLCKTRDVTIKDYMDGFRNFAKDVVFLFLPFMAICFSWRLQEIQESKDTIVESVTKLVSGYLLGKVWAFGIHYALHFPCLYRFHKRHHAPPQKLCASKSWEDSPVEYALMELPSFAASVLLFPTHSWIHLLHFAWHGWDGACGHSGFSGRTGWWLFDGEYHYYHHALLTVNYAEIEWFDVLCGTHHSQRGKQL